MPAVWIRPPSSVLGLNGLTEEGGLSVAPARNQPEGEMGLHHVSRSSARGSPRLTPGHSAPARAAWEREELWRARQMWERQEEGGLLIYKP